MRGGDEPARWARLVSGGDGDAGERVCGLSVWLAGPAGSGCGERWLGRGASGLLRERVLGRAQRCGGAGRAGLWRRCGPKVRGWAGERLGRAERGWAWAAVGLKADFFFGFFFLFPILLLSKSNSNKV